MPCRSDYMESDLTEKYNQDTAKLYQWAMSALGYRGSSHVNKHAADPYCKQDYTAALCGMLGELSPDVRQNLMLHSTDSVMGAKLNLWYAEHLAGEERRAKEDRAAALHKQTVKNALVKLTKSEVAALKKEWK